MNTPQYIEKKAKLWDSFVAAGGTHRLTVRITDPSSQYSGNVETIGQLTDYLEDFAEKKLRLNAQAKESMESIGSPIK